MRTSSASANAPRTLHPLLVSALILSASASLMAGCGSPRDTDKGPAQQTGQAVDKAADQTGQAAKDATKATGQAVEDTGKDIKKAAD